MPINYDWMPGSFATKNARLLQECSTLYSQHYGIWEADGQGHDGKPIRLSAARIRAWMDSTDSKMACAREDGELVGYAIAIRTKLQRLGTITWVSQLVVHTNHRRKGIAKNLLFALWNFSDHFAWGLVSANPFAVRALEKATRRRCSPARVWKDHSVLLSAGVAHIPYIRDVHEVDIRAGASAINTKFFLDHSKVNQMISDASRPEAPWVLGSLKHGWEWFAFTFNDQPQIKLTADEINDMITTSDDVVRQAYSRMTLDKGHSWTRHSQKESAFVIKECRLGPTYSVLDLGCGTGRHSLQLAGRQLNVTGVDYIGSFISAARDAAKIQTGNATFIEGDCRSLTLNQQFDAVICLYDVIGSFADRRQNFRIMRTIASHLKPEGYALVSVMNAVLTKKIAKHRFSVARDPNKLLGLKPSQTMERTGDVFDPEHFMLDEETGLVYRKEQFEIGSSLPAELIVRDRRYEPAEIGAELSAVGLKVHWTRCVRAGDWETALDPSDDRAKEILLLCSKLA